MNRYYTKGIDDVRKGQLAKLRSAHNLWYVYANPEVAGAVRAGLKTSLEKENPNDRYDFESVLDECGFGYLEKLPNLESGSTLWEVILD
jgi:hypothetical protein